MREVLLPEDNSSAIYLRPSGSTEATDYAPSIWQDNCCISRNRDTLMANDNLVAESYVVLDGLQDDATRLEPGELAEYIRVKLNLAIQLACEGERERRCGHWESAEGYKCRWEKVMAEVKRLLPALRNSGVSLFGKSHARNSLRAG